MTDSRMTDDRRTRSLVYWARILTVSGPYINRITCVSGPHINGCAPELQEEDRGGRRAGASRQGRRSDRTGAGPDAGPDAGMGSGMGGGRDGCDGGGGGGGEERGAGGVSEAGHVSERPPSGAGVGLVEMLDSLAGQVVRLG